MTVDKAAYVGRPKDEVKKELEDLGLKVDEQDGRQPVGAPAEDTVADVSPSGEVEPGSRRSRSSVYGDPVTTETNPARAPARATGNGNGNGKGKK